MDDEHIKSQVRFGKRRLNAIIIPSMSEVEAEITPIGRNRGSNFLAIVAEIDRTCIEPAVIVLREFGFKTEATHLSQDATKALWDGYNVEQVKDQIKREVSRIDPALLTLLLERQAALDAKPE